MAIAGVLTFLAPKKYQAATFLLFNFKEDNPFDTTMLPAQLSSSYLETQLDVIRSHNVALKVVDQLEMADKPGWRDAYKKAGVKTIPIRDWIASQLLTNLLVEPLPNSSHVVSVSYEAAAPEDAAKIANAFAKAIYHYHTGAHARAGAPQCRLVRRAAEGPEEASRSGAGRSDRLSGREGHRGAGREAGGGKPAPGRYFQEAGRCADRIPTKCARGSSARITRTTLPRCSARTR